MTTTGDGISSTITVGTVNNPVSSGMLIEAGNTIIGGSGVLSSVRFSGGGQFPVIHLQAVNGIGTQAAPVRILDGSDATGPDVQFLNTSATTGDISVSLVTGDIAPTGDFGGLFNSNPNGNYIINVENGNFLLGIPFMPNFLPLLAGQGVSFSTPNGSIIFNPGSSVQTFGAGNITLNATNTNISTGGNGVFLAPGSSLQASGIGNISIGGTAPSALGGAGVFVGGDVIANGGNITINGTGGTNAGSSVVFGVGNPSGSTPTIQAGNTVTITGHGGTSSSGGAQGVGFSGGLIEGQNVVITGNGGASVTGGAAGVIFSNLTDVNAQGNLSITGIGGSGGGSSGGSALGVILGSSFDSNPVHVSALGTVTMTGVGGVGTNVGATGISVNFGSTIESLGGITMTGTGGTVSVDGAAVGISLTNSTVQTASSGNILLTGTGGT